MLSADRSEISTHALSTTAYIFSCDRGFTVRSSYALTHKPTLLFPVIAPLAALIRLCAGFETQWFLVGSCYGGK